MYAINYDGLRKRDTYNELIDYIQFGQEKITYPDRFAKRIRESPQISNLLDGEGLGKGDMEEQQLNHMKEILKEFAVREAGGTAQFARAAEPPPPPPPPPPPSFTSHTRAFFGGHRGPGAAPASFNIGTPRAGSSGDRVPDNDANMQDQADNVRDTSQVMARAATDRAQNNANRMSESLKETDAKMWMAAMAGLDQTAYILGQWRDKVDRGLTYEKRIERYKRVRNAGGNYKLVNRDMVQTQQKEKRDTALNEKRVRNRLPNPPPHPLHPDDPHPKKINHPTIHDKNKANKNVLRGPYYHKGEFKKSSNY